MDEFLKQIEAQIGDWSCAGMTLGEIGNKLVEMRLLRERLDAIITTINEFSRYASSIALQMFEDADLPDAKIIMDNGYSMGVRDNIDGKVVDSSTLAAYLFETGEAAIGQVQIPPAMVSEELKAKLIARADGVEMKIHPGTWGKWLREQIQEGKIDLLDKATWPSGVDISIWQDIQIRKQPNK